MALTGDWFNELGSKLSIQVQGDRLAGKYTTAKSDKGCAKGEFDLVGMTDVGRVLSDGSRGDTVGWVVTWWNDESSCESTTAWCGVYHADLEVLNALWLLATKVDEDWKSTLVGKDVFTRKPPSEQRQALATAHGQMPQP